MVKFKISMNGYIGNIKKRFFGGSGEPELYKTDDPNEIEILSRSKSAVEIYEPPPELIIAERLRSQKQALVGLKWNDLCKGPGKGIYKVGMDKEMLIDAILAKTEEKLQESYRQYKAEEEAKIEQQDERARAGNKSPKVVVGVRSAHAE